jgi:trehalose 6-phosphate phosphatase
VNGRLDGHPPVFDRWPEVLARVRALAATNGPMLVVSDFDGTLAPVDPDPMGARIEPIARSALRHLARLEAVRPSRLRVVVLSGRTARDVAGRVRVGGIGYLGNHGLEGGLLPRGVPAERLAVRSDAGLKGFVEPARALGRAVAAALGEPAWLFVEDKGPSVAFHYRAARDPAAALGRIVGAVDERFRNHGDRGFERFDSRRIVEFRPAGAGGKGAAMARLLERERPAAAIVLGADRSDAEAFRVVSAARADGRLGASLAIAVHASVDTPLELVEAADLVLATPREAARSLSALAAALERGWAHREELAARSAVPSAVRSERPIERRGN